MYIVLFSLFLESYLRIQINPSIQFDFSLLDMENESECLKCNAPQGTADKQLATILLLKIKFVLYLY